MAPPATPSVPLGDLPVAALSVRPDGVIAYANPPALALLGRPVAGLALGAVLLRGTGGEGARERWRAEARSPDDVPFAVDVASTRAADGSRVLVLREPSERALLGESAQHLSAVFDSAPIGMAFFDTEGRYIRVNRALCALLGRTEEELLGTRDSDLTHPDDRRSDRDAAWRILRGELDTWQTEKRFVRPDGSVAWAIANLSFLRDEDGVPLTWLGQFQDITERKALEKRLRGLADEDPLTGAANRRRLDDALRDALAAGARHGHGGLLVYVDLDGFKAVNDTHGHAAGDALLREAAAAMRACCRTDDVIARVGGDEFAVLVPVATRDHATAITARLQHALDAVTIDLHGTRVSLAASLGTAFFTPEDDLTPDAVMAAADRAMYEGRGRG